MKLPEQLQVLGFKICWATAGYVPKSFRYFLANQIANITFSKKGLGVQRLIFNIARVKNLDSNDFDVLNIARKAMQSYMRYWVDMFAMTKLNDDQVLNCVSVKNDTEFKTVFKNGKGAVLAVTHSGNWDLAGSYIALKYGGVTTVAERLRPVQLFDEFTKHRLRRRIEILPHRGGKVPPSIALDERLKSGKLIGLVSDRDMSHHGIEVDFFLHKAKMPIGAAKLAIDNNAPLIPAAIYEGNGGTVIEFYPQIDTSSGDTNQVTQLLARTFEEIISKNPENWHMLQKIWVDMPKVLESAK